MEKSALSLVNLVVEADALLQMVILILVLASICSWSIIFDKIIKIHLLKKRSSYFEEVFQSSMTLEDIYKEAKKTNNHPLARIFIACMQEWKNNDIKYIINEAPQKKPALKERLMVAMQVAANQSVQRLESGLNFLAITGSAAPFIGLFGTVWGIMSSFHGIAIAKNTSLAVVAPGITEALLATAIGLFAAIPAVFFYNIFSAKINQFNERAHNFALQFLNILSRQLDR
jgi:biopolymer transport protein TolQ